MRKWLSSHWTDEVMGPGEAKQAVPDGRTRANRQDGPSPIAFPQASPPLVIRDLKEMWLVLE